MKYDVVARDAARVEAIGAHDGYRLHLVARPDRLSGRFAVEVSVRGSESEAEVDLDRESALVRADSAAEALDLGHACAVAWIDRQDNRAR